MPQDRNVRAIQEKYQRLMFIEIGQYYKIPSCCIKQFCDEVEFGISPAVYLEKVWKVEFTNDVPYIPCNSCMSSKAIKKFIIKL